MNAEIDVVVYSAWRGRYASWIEFFATQPSFDIAPIRAFWTFANNLIAIVAVSESNAAKSFASIVR